MSATNALAIPSGSFTGFRRGYYANPDTAPDNVIVNPSINVIIDTNGNVAQRLGYQTESLIALGGASTPATSFYLEQYDVTVFAFGTTIKYYDWTTQQVYATGITLTSGTVTRMDAYAGDVYVTNTTDGVARIVFSRLNGAATAGATTLHVDNDGAARLSVFSITSGTIYINGTAEAYSAVTVAADSTLTVTALTASYPDNAIFTRVDTTNTSSLEKFSKLFFWKERMGGFGPPSASNADQPNATVYFGKFASSLQLEDIVNFTYGAGGATRELVGKWGKITNVVPVKDFLYTFKENQAYLCAASSVVTSGSSIGQSTPDLRDEIHGCLNEDSACSIGNNEMCYITSDKRIMRIRIATDSGAAVVFPDETFDTFIQDDLKDMDADQTGARAFYHRGKRRSYFQIKISGQWYWYIYDHSLPVYQATAMGTNVMFGGWYAPQQVVFAQDFFERRGVLYATDGTTATVYSIGTSFDDDGSPVTAEAYTGNFKVGSAEIRNIQCQGAISQAAVIRMKAYITNTNGGRQATSEKIIDGSTFTYDVTHGVGADGIGAGGVESVTTLTKDWERNFDTYPSEANRVQFVIRNESGGYFSVSSYGIIGKIYPSRSSSL